MHSTPSTLDLGFWSCIHLAVLNVTGKNIICGNMKGGIKSELEIINSNIFIVLRLSMPSVNCMVTLQLFSPTMQIQLNPWNAFNNKKRRRKRKVDI